VCENGINAGRTPFSNLDNAKVMVGVMSGLVPQRPSACVNDAIFRMMQQCWSKKPQDRPTFKSIVATLSDVRFQFTFLFLCWVMNEGCKFKIFLIVPNVDQ
jgi:hypothetical protein